MKEKIPLRTDPSKPAEYDDSIVLAIKALATGTASEGQQKRALAWIVNVVCRHGDMAYFPNIRDTDFCLGMQHVGRQIVTLVNADLSDETAQ